MARPFFVSSIDVEGSSFCYDEVKKCRFCNCNVGYRFDSFQVGCETVARFMFHVYRTLSSQQPADISTADNPGAEIRWG